MHYEIKNKTGGSNMSDTQMVNIDFDEIAPGIVVYKNVYSGDVNLVDFLEEIASDGDTPWLDAYVKSGDTTSLNKNERDTKTIGVPYYVNTDSIPESVLDRLKIAKLSKILREFFTPIERNYSEKYGVWYLDHDTFSVLKYGVGQKFVNHIDDHSDFHRRISFVYYINDNYSGGEINFPRFNVSYKPNANELLVFPSTYVYNHSVSPVTDGTRYAVVSWVK